MRQEAARAGLDIAQLATVVKNAREDFVNMGLGLGESTRRIGGISRELRNSQLGIQLRNLGYSAEEQAELAAQVMARQNAAGDRRALSDRQIAEITMQYGKELRIISDITGQDAKKAMEKARTQALEVDVLAKATEEGGAEGYKKMQQILATMPEVYKKGFMDVYSLGASTDTAFNLALANNPRLREQIDQQVGMIKRQGQSAGEAAIETGKLSEQTLKYAKDNPGIFRDIVRANRGFGQFADIAAFANQEVLEGLKRQEGATERAGKNADKMADNVKPLDTAVQKLENDTDRLRSALGENLLTPLTKFAETTAAGVKTIDQALREFGLGPKTEIPPANTPVPGGTGGGAATGGAKVGRRGAAAPTGGANPVPPGGSGPVVTATDLKIKPGFDSEKQLGGSAIMQMAQQVHAMLGGNYKHFSGFNDRAPAEDKNPAHPQGRAFDLVLNDLNQYPEVVAKLKSMGGFSKVLDESMAPADKTQRDKWGPHIHAEVAAAQGAVVPATTGGVNVKVAEGGASEVIAPLKNGRLPGMDEMIERLDQMISVMKDQRDTSEKIFNATA